MINSSRELLPLDEYNGWADFWRYQRGLNVIPTDTKNKRPLVPWTQYQDTPIPEEKYREWKQQDLFRNGMAIIPGKVWHNEESKGLYYISIDADKQSAIDEICTRNGTKASIKEVAQKFLTEQHTDDLGRAHFGFYSPIPFPKKSSDKITGIEVKGLGKHGIVNASPSIHHYTIDPITNNQIEYRHQIIGTYEPVVLSEVQAKELINHIDNICKNQGVEYLEKHSNSMLLDSDSKIYKGERHDSMIKIANRLLFRNSGNGKRLEDQLKQEFTNINNTRCIPPLEQQEIDQMWKDAVDYYRRISDQGQKNEKGKDLKEKEQSHADILVQLVTNTTTSFFKDQYGVAFALVNIKNDNHNEVVRLECNRFKRYLSKLFYDHHNGKVVGSEAINNAVQVLQARTEYEGKTLPLSLRIGCKNNNDGDMEFYYDLTNPTWQYIKITGQKWDVEENNNDSSILFVRYNQTPQVMPNRCYEPDVFDKFLNLTNVEGKQNKLLLKVYIVSLFIPEIAHAILVLHGEKGSAKSTLQLLIKKLVDPAKPSLLTIHNDRNEFVQQLSHNHVAFYDNLKHAPYWLSDEVCKAVTGIGQTKRKLYTDDEDIVYEYKRCLGFTGINITLTEPDALDRSILIELNRIANGDRRLESEIIAEFIELRPKLRFHI